MTSQLAVIVLNHNAGDEIIACLEAVAAQRPAEIVVVDNASTDGSAEKVAALKDIAFIRNETNTGFAAGANQAIRASTQPLVLLLNPDAIVRPGALAALQASLEQHPRAGAVGALVRNPDGTVQPTKRAFPSLGHAILHGLVGIFWPNNPGTRAYLLADAALGAARPVDWVACTATALRREAFESIGGFDEAFFFFVEDVDLCRRLSDAGWEIWFEPAAEAVHAWGVSWTQRPMKFLWMHQWNLFRYVRKHRRGAWVFAYPVIAAGLLVRFVLLALRWLITKRSIPAHRSVGGGA